MRSCVKTVNSLFLCTHRGEKDETNKIGPFVISSLTLVESLQDAIVIQQGDEGTGCHSAGWKFPEVKWYRLHQDAISIASPVDTIIYYDISWYCIYCIKLYSIINHITASSCFWSYTYTIGAFKIWKESDDSDGCGSAEGHDFYIVEEGSLVALKQRDGSEPVEVPFFQTHQWLIRLIRHKLIKVVL